MGDASEEWQAVRDVSVGDVVGSYDPVTVGGERGFLHLLFLALFLLCFYMSWKHCISLYL